MLITVTVLMTFNIPLNQISLKRESKAVNVVKQVSRQIDIQ